MPLRISFKTSPQRVDWATLDATWRLAGELGGWDGAWMNDHLTDMDPDVPGPSLEALTLLATLVHHVPGVRVGHAVLSNTFRHPVLLAKAATVMDHATGGRFVVGLGAGWFEGEHEPFGIPLPPIGERIDRLISAVEVLQALFSPEAVAAPGVTRPDPFYPLAGAVNAPAAAHPGRSADLPGRPEAARDRPGGAAGGRLAADGHRGWQRRVLRGPPRRRSCGRSTSSAATRRRSSSSGRCTRASTRRRVHRRWCRHARWWPPGRPRWSSGSRRRWGRGASRTRTGTSWGRCGRSSGRTGGMTIIRRIGPGDDDALVDYVRIRNTVAPENTDSLEQIAWEGRAYPGQGARFLALDAHGNAVGTATTGRIWMYGPEFERYWLGIWVLPQARGLGLGSALYAATSEVAREAGKTGFQTELSEVHEDGHRFLANRGFVETERLKMVRLELARLAAPGAHPPAGIRLVTLAERPDLLPGVHATAVETFPDIPWTDEPIAALDFEAFVARDVERTGIPKDAFFVAVDDASGTVAGYASLIYAAASTTVAYHDMTAVRRAYRGRGIAMALKRATIAWAIEHGIEALDTGNDEENAPMRAVNLALGYTPVPDWIGLRGPLAPTR